MVKETKKNKQIIDSLWTRGNCSTRIHTESYFKKYIKTNEHYVFINSFMMYAIKSSFGYEEDINSDIKRHINDYDYLDKLTNEDFVSIDINLDDVKSCNNDKHAYVFKVGDMIIALNKKYLLRVCTLLNSNTLWVYKDNKPVYIKTADREYGMIMPMKWDNKEEYLLK